jgi:hypothetical protein
MAIARQQHRKHMSAAMNKHATKKPLKVMPSTPPVMKLYTEGQQDKPVSWRPSLWLAMSTEAVEPPLLEAVMKQQLVKTQQTD